MSISGATSHSSAATVAEWNEVTDSRVDETLVVDALEQLRRKGWLSGSPAPLTEAEASFLQAHGGVRDNREALVRATVSSRVRAEAVGRGHLTVDETADLLGVSASRIRHRIGEGSIYAYPSSGRGTTRRIPSWQFDGGAPIPHLASVLAGLPEDYRPSEILDFVQNAEVDDPARNATVPLWTWLRDGGDPQPARELATALRDVI